MNREGEKARKIVIGKRMFYRQSLCPARLQYLLPNVFERLSSPVGPEHHVFPII
jgi:hypothetical protein